MLENVTNLINFVTRIFPAMVKPWNFFVKSSLLDQNVKLNKLNFFPNRKIASR